MSILNTFCQNFVSNTLAGSGSQHHVFFDDATERVGRIYYRLFEGGTYRYSLLFSNTIDSTFADGSHSYQGYACGEWEITSLKLGLTTHCDQHQAIEPIVMHPVTIKGSMPYTVQAGEMFCTDPIAITAESGDYLCVEIGFCGKDIPNHEESMIPSFVRQGDTWVSSRALPFPSMIGCDRQVKQRIAYLGDSITQGIGVAFGDYTFWNALTSEALGKENAYWNLGLGFGRAMDAAADDTWLAKAKQSDVVVVCYGVNDLGRGRSAEQILHDLATIVDKLHENGCRVLLQSVPPFDYPDDIRVKWEAVNHGIRHNLAQRADAACDIAPILQRDPDHPHCTKYGGHPNEEGCRAWTAALTPLLRELLR